jgi:hypothetical protein
MSVTINGTTGITTPNINVVTALPSMVRLNTSNGKGSTNTVISRFANIVTNQGTDITYADSATLGASFTINTSGVYAITLVGSSINSFFGISLNSTQLTTSIDSITVTDKLVEAGQGASGLPTPVSVTLYLPSGSVVRPHGTTVGDNNSTSSSFTIVRVS